MQTFKGCGLMIGVLLSGCSLTGCATVRYVQTYCITKQQLADLEAKKPVKIKGKLTGNADEDSRTEGAQLVRVDAYADGLLEVLGGCADPKSTTEAAH